MSFFCVWNGINHFRVKSLFLRQIIMLLFPFVFQHHSCCDNSRRGGVSPEGGISTQLYSSRGRGQLIIVPTSPGRGCFTVWRYGHVWIEMYFVLTKCLIWGRHSNVQISAINQTKRIATVLVVSAILYEICVEKKRQITKIYRYISFTYGCEKNVQLECKQNLLPPSMM